MGLINWIFDFYQQSRIEKMRDEVAQTIGDARDIPPGGERCAALPQLRALT